MRQCRQDWLEDAACYASGIDFSPRAIRQACGTFADDTAVGADNVILRRIKELPDRALEELGWMLKCALANLILPSGALINVLGLFGKKGGKSYHSNTCELLSADYAVSRGRCC